MRLADVATPGVMISQIAPHARETEGATRAVVETAMQQDWVRAIQTVEIVSSRERRAVADIVRAKGLRYTYCLARVQNDRGLNLSDIEGQRRANAQAIIGHLEEAVEAGADSVQLVSGPRPQQEALRPQALAALATSLAEIAEAAAHIGALRIGIEPLDFFAHKRHSLGSSAEAAAICAQLRRQGQRVELCLDTAHMLLNGESPAAALALCRPFVFELHLCNCVTEPGHPLYGDRHLPFGAPGRIDAVAAAALLAAAVADGFLNDRDRPTLQCEVLNTRGERPEVMIAEARRFLYATWALADAKLQGGAGEPRRQETK